MKEMKKKKYIRNKRNLNRRKKKEKDIDMKQGERERNVKGEMRDEGKNELNKREVQRIRMKKREKRKQKEGKKMAEMRDNWRYVKMKWNEMRKL